ncbi:MAG: thymidine phosphorylase, partial [Candidatus Pacearchaeota archaeon]
KFLKIAKHFGLKTKVILTDGSQPIGNGIGPVLEMLDVIRVLKQQNPPKDLEEKSILIAGEIFEMVGKAKSGEGKKLAIEILKSGKAYQKFNEIIDAQGKKNIILEPAKLRYEIKADKDGKILFIDNKSINLLGRILGCPLDKSAGIYLHKHNNDIVRKNETIMTLYAESDKKLKEAIAYYNESKPILVK